jgi:lipopolysaccharide transport system ATP-binding protein
VEKFLDTPVKRYSSGMYVRLAFAVAAHLEPEILIVDEVLAVGDAQFQKKCLGKMGEAAKGGRTVLFVSHQMNVISGICNRAILLAKGQITYQDTARNVVDRYFGLIVADGTQWVSTGERHLSDPAFTVTRFCVVNEALQTVTSALQGRDKIGIMIEGEVMEVNPLLTVGFAIYSNSGALLWWTTQFDTPEKKWPKLKPGKQTFVAWIPPHTLNEGSYRCDLIVSIHWKKWISEPVVNAPSITFEIRGGLSDSPYWQEARPGLMAPVLSFSSIN